MLSKIYKKKRRKIPIKTTTPIKTSKTQKLQSEKSELEQTDSVRINGPVFTSDLRVCAKDYSKPRINTYF